MDSKRLQSSKDRKLKRKEVLEKKKVIEEIIKAASTVKDHLASFLSFSYYDRNGLSVYFESGFGDQLSSSIKKYIQNLLKVNMEGPYGPDWPIEEKVKRREMVAPEARYIFVRESSNVVHDDNYLKEDGRMNCWTGDGDPLVGFVHYRFIAEEEIPVVYVYELQLETCARGNGLGKFLMQLIELIARKELKQGLTAQRHALIVAKNLKMLMKGVKGCKLARYKPSQPQAWISLGRRDAVVQYSFLTVSGFVPGMFRSRDLFIGKMRKSLGLD